MLEDFTPRSQNDRWMLELLSTLKSMDDKLEKLIPKEVPTKPTVQRRKKVNEVKENV